MGARHYQPPAPGSADCDVVPVRWPRKLGGCSVVGVGVLGRTVTFLSWRLVITRSLRICPYAPQPWSHSGDTLTSSPSPTGFEHLEDGRVWVSLQPQDTFRKHQLCGQRVVGGRALSEFKPCSEKRWGKWFRGVESHLPGRVARAWELCPPSAAPVLEMLDETGPAAPVGCRYLLTKHEAPVTMATAQSRE